LSHEDAPDGIWTGTTWEALRHSREVLEMRVERRSSPDQVPGVIVIGDPYAPPDAETRSLVADGAPVVVPHGSVTSMIWPDARTWVEVDDLADLLTGGAFELVGKRSSLVLRPDPVTRPERPMLERKVSVGIPVFREVTFLQECVESILAQDFPPHEVILYDDGSQSAEVDRALARLADQESRVRLMRGEHRGVCVARNNMMKDMEGDSFLFVDSDDHLLPAFLSRCATMLDTGDDLWAVATWTEFFGAYEAIEAKPPFDARVGVRENPIISTSALVDVRVREEGIRFAPDLAFLYCEDWHLWSQIIAAGGKMGLVPAPLARHRVHTSSGGYLRTELAHAVGRSRATEPLLIPRDLPDGIAGQSLDSDVV
jgi:GT2 family glycosyltransferase